MAAQLIDEDDIAPDEPDESELREWMNELGMHTTSKEAPWVDELDEGQVFDGVYEADGELEEADDSGTYLDGDGYDGFVADRDDSEYAATGIHARTTGEVNNGVYTGHSSGENAYRDIAAYNDDNGTYVYMDDEDVGEGVAGDYVNEMAEWDGGDLNLETQYDAGSAMVATSENWGVAVWLWLVVLQNLKIHFFLFQQC
jgi:hypothetical protein